MKSIFAHVLFFISIVDFLCVFCKKKKYATYPEVVSRATTFLPRVQGKTCLLKPDGGPCRAEIIMYYFDPATMACSTFTWGGCQGNGNRFDSREQCLDRCLTKPNQRGSRPQWCSLSFDYGFCFGALERWYYDHLWKVCKKTIYSGCGGNKNNFYNQEQCESICRFGKGPIPIQTTERGGMKKVLIINPWDTTPRRGRDQTAGVSSKVNNTTSAG
ncbi:hypothetical protein O3G_MSEX003697 [Manduca sexta]|uniref:BPTI/Kunitz inhibitor domain-containing protein n=1 Tax=Manduca sexta TaxID=7130 RepID=A0A922CFG4_MANSE|nr:hypothetical protein O3G_MSEX003697 [Manduca sexta]KAG6445056.1 hypothetical protein O3G_MSEX003697 [Manduca sexta]